MTEYTSVSHSEARALVRRAIEKAEEFSQRATYVLVDRKGVIITASRMDGALIMSYRISRAKAHNAAIYGMSNGDMYDFSMNGPPILIHEIMQITREPIFHGAGSQVIRRDGKVVGAMTTGMGVPPFVKVAGIEPEQLIWDGKATNAEDHIMAYALRQPYIPQHGDDEKNWVAVYGKPPEGKGKGGNEAPKSTKQVELDAAIKLADAAIAEAERRKLRISVVVVDDAGEVIQLDRMDGGAPMTPDAATALAVTAVNFQAPSTAAAGYPDLNGLAATTTFKFLGVPGGLPLFRDGLVSGGIGVSGADPKVCEEIAQIAINAK